MRQLGWQVICKTPYSSILEISYGLQDRVLGFSFSFTKLSARLLWQSTRFLLTSPDRMKNATLYFSLKKTGRVVFSTHQINVISALLKNLRASSGDLFKRAYLPADVITFADHAFEDALGRMFFPADRKVDYREYLIFSYSSGLILHFLS